MRTLYCLICVCVAALFAGACKSNCESSKGPDLRAELSDTRWEPVFVKDLGKAKAPDPSKGDDPVFLRFSKDLSVNGMSGDNLFGGNPEISPDGAFSGGNFFSTRRAGPFGEYEAKFLKALGEADKIELSGASLKFYQGSEVLLDFKKSP